MKNSKHIFLMASLLFLVSCGGGSGSRIGGGTDGNNIPVATPQNITLHQNDVKDIALTGTDLDNDNLTFSVVTPPSHGVFDGTTYTPNSNYYGEDSIVFIASDGIDNSEQAIISLDVQDVTRPTLSIMNNNQGRVTVETGDALFTIEFSEDVVGFTKEDISVQYGTVSGLTGNGSTYEVAVTPDVHSRDAIILNVAENATEDPSGNGNRGSNYVRQLVNTQIPFITTWKTDNEGRSSDNQIKISTFGTGYDYRVNWGDGVIESNLKGDRTHTYSHAGIYTLKIAGDFPQIYFSADKETDNNKLISVEQWGNVQWKSMNKAFYKCEKLTVNGSDNPDLSNVEDMSYMFAGVASIEQNIGTWDTGHVKDMSFMFSRVSIVSTFNQDIGSWDTSTVENMQSMFDGARTFNQDIGSWNTQKVKNMKSMFKDASTFNQNISAWNTGHVTNMSLIFNEASKFNQDLNAWNTESVTDMSSAFKGATVFNKDLSSWDVSNVKDLSSMFQLAKAFNQNIGVWQTGNTSNMKFMFDGAKAFNKDISGWNTSNVINMISMFRHANNFEQNLSSWNISKVITMTEMFSGLSFVKETYDRYVSRWSLFGSTGASLRE